MEWMYLLLERQLCEELGHAVAFRRRALLADLFDLPRGGDHLLLLLGRAALSAPFAAVGTRFG